MGRKKIIEIVLDTETTGLDYTKEKMVEFAAVRLENGKIKDEYPKANIVAIDYDPSASKVNQENRIRLMLANAKLSEEMKASI